MTVVNAISRACKYVGGQAALARAVGVPPAFVFQWLNNKRPVPVSRCPAIEQATNGAVTCEELRPDFDWQYLRNSKKVEA